MGVNLNAFFVPTKAQDTVDCAGRHASICPPFGVTDEFRGKNHRRGCSDSILNTTTEGGRRAPQRHTRTARHAQYGPMPAPIAALPRPGGPTAAPGSLGRDRWQSRAEQSQVGPLLAAPRPLRRVGPLPRGAGDCKDALRGAPLLRDPEVLRHEGGSAAYPAPLVGPRKGDGG